MEFKNEYLAGVYAKVEKRNPGESEFLQAVKRGPRDPRARCRAQT